MSDSIALAIRPIVRYPRVAQVGKTYLMTIDLEVELGAEWQYEEEEYPVYCEVHSDAFSCKSVGNPVLVLHRFGGNYGEVRFLIKPLQELSEKCITIKLINKWGISLKILKLENFISVENSQVHMSRNQLYSEEELLLSLLRIESLSELENSDKEISIAPISDREDSSVNSLLDVDKALIWINQHLKSAGKAELVDLKCQVFRGCWNRDTYPSIAKSQNRDLDYIRDVCSELLQDISKIFGERITRQNFRSAIQQRIALSELGNSEERISIASISEREDSSMSKLLDADEALIWINQYLKSEGGSGLTDLECQVFRGCWNRETYQKIAVQHNRDHDYIREVGSDLLRQVSQLFEQRVTRKNLRTIVEEKIRVEVTATEVVAVGRIAVGQLDSRALDNTNQSSSHDRESIDYDPTFLGRDEDGAEIDRKWRQDQSSVILIHGAGGMGKTRFARKFFEQMHFSLVLECWIPPESARSLSAEQQVETWLKQHFNEEADRDFYSSLDRLHHCLRQRLEQTQGPIGVLLDNFDALLDGRGRFRPDARSYLDLLRMLADHGPQTLTLITSREVIQESLVNLTLHSLQGLSIEAWERAFSSYDIVVSPQVLQEMWDACQGNATAMKILRGKMRDRYEGNPEAYWENCGRNVLNDYQLQELVASQFEKLRQQYKYAYDLLCRLGCYRYEMPSYITISGVNALLWDVPESEHRSVVQSLQNLALIESRRGDIFWLHPMIHAEARQRLRHTSDWTVAHGRAIGFWLASPARIEKVEQTHPFLEAYYHALDMEDYDKACEILMQPVSSLWGNQLSFGWVLYRFRSLQQIIKTAEPILNEIDADLTLGRLCNLLGYTYRATGDLNRALIYHQKARSIAEEQGLTHLRISSLLNLGLCHRDRWDIDSAIAEFKTVYDLSVDDSSTGYQRYSACCLAYLYSGWGDKTVALDYMHAINTYELIQTGSSWGQAYSLLYLGHAYRNLGEYEMALELFQEVLIASKASDFIPIYAMALSASAQIYRKFGQRPEAIERHSQAIDLLDTLGAKCDLAGAYAQRGLTYKIFGEEQKAWQDKGMAIGLFRAINVPKQVEWVGEAFR